VMITRNLYSALVMAGVGFGLFYWLIAQGYETSHARNLLLLLFVIFENFQALNARSEHHSLFHRGLFSSPLLIASVVGAQVIHLAASHVPGLADTLRIWPPTVAEWGALLAAGSSLLVVMELEKWWTERHKRPKARPEPEVAIAPPSRLRRYAPLAASAALVVAVAAAGTLYWQTLRKAPPELATVERGDVVRIVDVAGVVVAPPPAEAAAPVAGKIEAVACGDGDQVEAGRVCATIIPPDRQAEVDRARKALAAAQAAQRNNAAALERATSAKARAAVARAKARLAQAQTLTSRREAALRTVLEKGAPVVAPIAGTIGGSRLEDGRATNVGQTLFHVGSAEEVLDIQTASEAGALLQAPRGVPVTATVETHPSQLVSGKLRMTLPTEGGARIVVEAPTPLSAPRPGAPARVRIELDRRGNVLRIPSRALQFSPKDGASLPPPPAGWARVWAWRDGTMAPVDVKPGLDDGAFVEIRGGALEVGDRVVVNRESQAPQEP
jgi:P-type Ca2+ transporter type 2C